MERGSLEYFLEQDPCCPRLLSCIIYEILVCICLTLPTVWHPLTTSWSATVPISALRFSLLSPLSPPQPLHAPLQLVIFLSLAYSLTLASSYILLYFHILPSLYPHFLHFLLIYSLSRCCTPPIYFLTLCSYSLREMELCKLFSPWCIPSLLSVHLNELISPFFS